MNFHYDGISSPLPDAKLIILSLGAGVQSTTLALMAARQEIGPMPHAAIFADTQAEPKSVYDHLNWLERQIPFPVYRVTIGSLRDSVVTASKWSDGKFSPVPFFIDGGGPGRRQCTKEFKIIPIHQKIRELLGLNFRQRGPKSPVVEQWIGISTDEITRMKSSGKTFIQNRWPLIEARMSRRACLKWMAERQYPSPPKSACTFCPYRSDAEWKTLKENDPQAFLDAVAVDEIIRERGTAEGINRRQFVHRSFSPLNEVDFDKQSHQKNFGFEEECDGMCGV